MQHSTLLLSFLPGFAPILIYIAVDAFFGETAGLVAGVALGLGEFFFILIREKRVDAFTLVDTALLVAMGFLSWVFSDPVYFRLKPAVSGGVLALMMVAGALGPHRFFLPYMEKKMGMGEIPEAAARRMLAMIAGFGLLALSHSALTAVAALYWSRAVWDFIAGALFWILAFAYMASWTVPSLVMRARGVRHARASVSSEIPETCEPSETLPIVDAQGRIVGKAPRFVCHSGGTASSGTKLLHPVVRLWLADGAGNYWLQKRSATKLVQPGKWDCAVGGHISFGESVEAALRREAREEIGLLDPGAIRPLGQFLRETPMERELVFTFIATLPPSAVFHPDMDEVDEVRLWSAAEIRDALGDAQRASQSASLCRQPGDTGLTELTIHELDIFSEFNLKKHRSQKYQQPQA